jgi:hypothetical protein
MSWNSLPLELRLEIFNYLCYSTHTYRPENRYALAGYASVCREWQDFFEPITFSRLLLDQSRIAELDRLTAATSPYEISADRQLSVRQIHFRVKLADYDCNVCQREQDPDARRKDNLIFTQAVVDLLTVLSKWPKRIEDPRTPKRMRLEGLTLEISAYSPSDCKHGFRDFRLQDDYPIWFDCDKYTDQMRDWPAERQRASQMKLERYHDPGHGWENGRQTAVSLGARKRITQRLRLCGGDGAKTTPPRLPKVRVVTAFTIRRQSYRAIDTPTLKKLLTAFPNLRTFTHEPWHNVTPEGQQRFESDYLRLLRILPRLNKNLRQVSLFQDYCKTLNPDRCTDGRDWRLGEESRRPLGCELATTARSAGMEFVSAAYLIDAYDFFHGFDVYPQQQPGEAPHVWDKLQTLFLTSSRLSPHVAEWKRHELLARAGRAAALMPSLQNMILWNGGEGFLYFMQYLCDNDGSHGTRARPLPLLIVKSQYGKSNAVEHRLSPEVISVWQLVPESAWKLVPKSARGPRPGELDVRIRRFKRPETSVKTFATTVDVLKRWGVVHRVTAHQLRAEETIFRPVTDGSQETGLEGEGEP